MWKSNQSEIAKLRTQIEAEHTACVLAIEGPLEGAARHDFINERFRRMDEYHQKLRDVIGEEAAIQIVLEIFEKH